MQDFDNFLIVRNQTDTGTVRNVPSTPLPYTIPVMPTALVQYIPATPGTPTQYASTNTFMPNVRLDVKQYPIFNGKSSSWIKFKCGVLSIASTHGLDEVFDENKIPPVPGDSDFKIF